jgi:cytoskeletal protein RodZ
VSEGKLAMRNSHLHNFKMRYSNAISLLFLLFLIQLLYAFPVPDEESTDAASGTGSSDSKPADVAVPKESGEASADSSPKEAEAAPSEPKDESTSSESSDTPSESSTTPIATSDANAPLESTGSSQETTESTDAPKEAGGEPTKASSES